MVFTKAQAKALSILEVAKRLGMEMERISHKEYYWKEHDSFKINTVKNTWTWYSRTGKFGDTINLVQEIKGVSYKEAMTFLETGNFPEATIVEEERKHFRYTLAPYEQPFRKARSYLKETRGLSDETIDFFLEKGVLAEASYRDRDGYVEDVLVFKFLDRNHHIVGASLQGLSPFPDRHDGKGYLKKIMYQSEGIAGLNVAIGSPKRLIVAEAPIDLMSYYELHKDELEDVCLVAMDGLKEGTLSRYAMEVLQERGAAKEVSLDYTQSKDLRQASNFLSETARLTNLFHDNNHQDFLTLAVDNDKAGQDFIDQLQEKKIPVVDGRPPKATNEKKMDWNAYLQLKKKGQLMEHQKRLTQNKEVEPHRKETKSKKTKTAEEHYFDWIERMAATVQEQLQLPSPPKLASELEAVVGPFITTDLDQLFARRLSLALDTQRVEQSEILSVYQKIEQLDKQISERMRETELRESEIEVIFYSSDEPLLSRYSSGEIIPYTEFVSILYPKNAKLFNENPRTGPTVSFSNDGGTWFGLRTADGQMLVERFRYDVGLEGESISERLNRILSPAHLEQIRQIDTDFDIPSYIEDKNKELGIEVKLYRDKEHIDTLDFNDLINHPNIEEMANELGHTSLSSYPEEFTIEILDKRLNQSQLTALLDQIIELGKEKDGLKQFLTEQLTSLSQSTRPDIFRALTENERTHISEFFKTLIPNVTTSYEFTEEGVEYLSYRIRNMEFASSHPELRELSPEEQYQSLLKFFDKHYGKPFPLPSDQTVMGIELLQEKFGYNPKLPLAVYRDSAQNMDRIAEKEEEAFRSTFDKTMFAKSLELVQKYSLQEVMEGIDIWSGGDEARLEALNSDLRDISLQPLKDFVERYIDPSLYLSHGFEDSPLASLSFQDLADLSHEKGLLDVNGKLVNQKDHMEKEKALEQSQGYEKSAESTSEDLPKLNIWSSTNENAILSNLAVSPIWIRNFRFESVEHAYQTLKSNGFTSEALTWAESNRQAFKQGRKVQSAYQLGPTNKLTSITLMEKLLTERFLQDAEFREALIQTKGFTLTHKQDNGIWKKEFPRILMDLRDGKLVNQKDHMEKEKAPNRSQEPISNAGDLHRNPDSLGDISPRTASKPVVNESQPDFPVIAPLKFTTKGEWMSTLKPGYHVITDGELRRLNKFAPGLQATAQWYLNELAGSTITYLYQDRDGIGRLDVQFSDENFAHLTGISPKGIEMKQVVYDFANGQGDYGNIQVSHSIKDKSMVLPLLPDILSSQAFVFNDLSTVEKFHKIDLEQAIKTDDEDLLLAIRDVDGIGVPASIMRIKEKLSVELEGKEQVVLGVYRERDGIIEQLSIHPDYVKDGGQSMMTVLKNKQYETLSTLQMMQEETNITSLSSDDRLQDEPALPVSMMDSDADGISDEEEKKQGSNPYDFRSQPATKHQGEREKQEVEDSSLVIASLIQNQDIAGLNLHLKEGIKEYLDSDKYKDYLTKMSQLNNYSSRNLRLILAQQPTASQVASFKQWKETFGRHVKKGEKALRIFVPITYIKKDENNQPILDKDGKPEIGTTFRLKAAVFDVSQTDGKEMPKAVSDVKDQLTDQDYGNLYRTLMTIAKNNHVSVRFEELEESRKGYYDTASHQIVLNKVGMNKSQLIKTFLQETAHSELHHKDHPQKDQLTRSNAELQAESVTYVVASYYGLDTSDYSFGYLASWSQDKDTLRDLEAQLDIVQQEAKSLIERMDKEMEVLRLSQVKQTQHQFENKLNHFKEQSDKQLKELQEKRQAEATSKKEKGISK
ncbi:PBECR4 domain-containing protein [Streptococcus suis]|uniref:PBECR4 domain-containing protein n=1 Tax=Streptococcus suis TaxID=1307 RepID=UPI0020BE61BD|nr:PBECR4 domain-containing protein [Streptococcus suis]